MKDVVLEPRSGEGGCSRRAGTAVRLACKSNSEGTDRNEMKVAFPLTGGCRSATGGVTAAVLRKKGSGVNDSRALRRTAATYSPNWWVSTIGDGEFNFSVRNGKRWVLTAIATAIYC